MPGETGIDGKPYEDYFAYDVDRYAGRIQLELANLGEGLGIGPALARSCRCDEGGETASMGGSVRSRGRPQKSHCWS